jgi:NAD(P)-dependent dehydrogenase (short-subunit alcohol dehydrogenase family)
MERESSMPGNTWFITGASSGLGYALARHVLEEGDRVVMGARTVGPMSELAGHFPGHALVVKLDVTDPDQRASAVQVCEDHFGSLDVLVNSAGTDFWGAIEEQDEADYRATFEVNLFGAIELSRLALPGMRSRQRGTIVNMSSLRGIVSVGGNGYYASSKFALEGLTEALWQEIEPLGLRAFLVEPGPHRTGMDTRVRFSGSVIDAYEGSSGRIVKIMANIKPEQFLGDPTRAATAIYQEVCANSKRRRIILGSEAYRQIGAKLDALQSELHSIKDLAFSTDYPGAGPGVL